MRNWRALQQRGGPNAWQQLKVPKPLREGAHAVRGGWQQGRQGPLRGKCQPRPRLENATVNASECVRPRSSRPPATSLGALKEWAAWTLDIRNALLRADGFGRDAYLHAPVGRDPSDPHRMWNLHAPANGLHDAPVAFRRPLWKYSLNSMDSSTRADRKFRGSSLTRVYLSLFGNRLEQLGLLQLILTIFLGVGAGCVIQDARFFEQEQFLDAIVFEQEQF